MTDFASSFEGAADRPAGGLGKTERVYEGIRDRIVRGRYGPGYRLVINVLAQEFGTSAVPVREAIRRLEAEGMVLFRRHVGAEVASLDVTEWEATMYVIALLEGYVTALSAPQMSSADLDEARAMNARMEKEVQRGDLMAISALNKQFHRLIYRRCPSSHIAGLTLREWDRLDAMRSSIFISIPSRASESVAEHDELLDLIEKRVAPETIEAFAREHKLRTRAAYLSSAESARPEPDWAR